MENYNEEVKKITDLDNMIDAESYIDDKLEGLGIKDDMKEEVSELMKIMLDEYINTKDELQSSNDSWKRKTEEEEDFIILEPGNLDDKMKGKNISILFKNLDSQEIEDIVKQRNLQYKDVEYYECLFNFVG